MFYSEALNMINSSPMECVKNFMNDANLFLFATALRKVNDHYLYDLILYAKVYNNDELSSTSSAGILTEKIESTENLIASIENLYAPPRPISRQTFGVLGKEQLEFFKKTFPNIIENVLGFFVPNIEPEIRKARWSGKKHIYYRARRIEMFQTILHERMGATPFPITGKSSVFKELLIPEKLKELHDMEETHEIFSIPPLPKFIEYDRDFCNAILNINVLLHASELKKTIHTNASPSTKVYFQFKSIVFAPIHKQQKQLTRQFHNVAEFLAFIERLPLKDENFAVLGNEEREFFELVLKKKKNLVDVCFCIPEEVDYICRNVEHASYHAKRMEAYKDYFNTDCKKVFSDPRVKKKNVLKWDMNLATNSIFNTDISNSIFNNNASKSITTIPQNSTPNDIPTFNFNPPNKHSFDFLFEKKFDRPTVNHSIILDEIVNITMFIFATGLKKEDDNRYLYDSILFAKVHSSDDGELLSSYFAGEWHRNEEKNIMTTIENSFTPPRSFSSLTFAVLGIEQKYFFQSIWSDILLVDISEQSLPTLEAEKNMTSFNQFGEDFTRWTGWTPKDHVFFRARRVEMFQDVFCETDKTVLNSFKDLVIPERRNCVVPMSEDELNVCKDILKMKILIYAVGLKRLSIPEEKVSPFFGNFNPFLPNDSLFESPPEIFQNYSFRFIILADIHTQRQYSLPQFKNLEELWNYVEQRYSGDCIYSGVIGNEQQKFFNDVCNLEKRNIKCVDISFKIPDDIDYICHNMKHANYHARRIEALKVISSYTYDKLRTFPWKFS